MAKGKSGSSYRSAISGRYVTAAQGKTDRPNRGFIDLRDDVAAATATGAATWLVWRAEHPLAWL